MITDIQTTQGNNEIKIICKFKLVGQPPYFNAAKADSRRLGTMLVIAALKFEPFSGHLLSEDIIRYKSSGVTPQNVTSPRLEGSPMLDFSALN